MHTYVQPLLRWVLIVSLLIPFGQATPSQAALTTIACDDNRVENLIAAINDANTTATPDFINLTADCVYTLTASDNTGIIGGNGLPVITTPITIIGNGAIIERDMASDLFRLFFVETSGHLTLISITLRNGSGGYGGGIYNIGLLMIQQSTFIQNAVTDYGGAIMNDNGTVTVEQSTFSGNSALIQGGAIYTYLGSLGIRESTFSGNSAYNGIGGGILVNNTQVGLETSIVAGNSASNGPDIYAATQSIASDEGNVIGNNSTVATIFPSGTPNANNDWVGTADAPVDPLLSPLGDHGGPTWTFLPLSGSPAIDFGPITSPYTSDQRGFPRIQGGRVDSGAVEVQPVPSIAISDTTTLEGSAARLTLTLSTATFEAVTVDYNTSNGTALAGSDYVSTTGTLTFTPGMTETTILVSTTDDLLDEVDETFTVLLSNPTNATLSVTTATVTILDNDEPPALSIADTSVVEGATAQFTVTLDAPSAQNVQVDYATMSGIAEAGSDYTPISGTLTFTPGMTSTTILVSTRHELMYEPDETFTVLLSNPLNATLSTASATGTIINNDDVPAFVVLETIAEEDTNQVFWVMLDAYSSYTITVDYVTSDGTAQAGVDYTPISGTLTFTPGMTRTTLVVPVIDDLLDEADETFTLILSDATNATITDASTAGTIIDNDEPPMLRILDTVQTEGAALAFTVTLDAPSGLPITVDYLTSDGTAEAGVDYMSISGTLNFTPGMTQTTILVSTTDDLLDEADETFLLTLSNATNATLGTTTATATILDNDEPEVQLFQVYLPMVLRPAVNR